MNNHEWKTFFLVCADILGSGKSIATNSLSWCSWTTLRRLNEDSGYWTSGLPAHDDIAESCIKDGGVWGQPFPYSELAHVIIPRRFYWETEPGPAFSSGFREQDIDALSLKLKEAGVQHRKTDLILEVKIF